MSKDFTLFQNLCSAFCMALRESLTRTHVTWGDVAEFGWILLWGTVGGAIWFWCGGSKFWLVQIGTIVIVIASCEVYLIARSVWIPLIPAAMAVVFTPMAAIAANRWQTKLVDREW